MKKVWDKDRILIMLRNLHKSGTDLSYNGLSKKAQRLVSAAAYHFGSYRKAVARAGIDYAQVVRRPRWTKARIIQLIKQAHRSGEELSWSAVFRRRDELGKAAFASLQDRLFGSWEKALQAAGLKPARIRRYRRWTRDAVVAELKRRSRASEPLNSGALQRQASSLHAAAFRLFGSYDQALRTAGLDPAKLRQRRRWTPADVLKELRAFNRRHGQLTDALLRQRHSALYGAALRCFGTISSALKAAQSGARS